MPVRSIALRRALVLGLALALPLLGCAAQQPVAKEEAAGASSPATSSKPQWGIVIHGGAGVIRRETLSPEKEAAYRAKLTEALQAGHAILAQGGSSLDAVSAAIRIMEDSPLFNAGKGAVFNHDGQNELDAAIMDGKTLRAGAVAGVRHVKNPITLARKVMESSPHVMMVGDGAEAFAKEQGIELVPAEYFRTEERWQQLQKALEQEKASPPGQPSSSLMPSRDPATGGDKFGTVGAVALDQSGNLAAATSTGGMTNKRYGRVGDSPLIGAGTYASPRCAISATGHGEFFIRYTVAHDICARMEYLKLPLQEAARWVVMDELVKAGGEGGVIAMDAQGHVAMPFNSSGMYRGYMGEDGTPHVAIFQE
ncbi:MAG: isoaspartyl peptidase/L-asparaginase family protein [Hyalangium sp.]|uniref:isoaspartyl peptidase/L-asparaginase family protein n=1 Tax=Hyalangium sp. TaxID=2028555 RepID=UPI00389A35D9